MDNDTILSQQSDFFRRNRSGCAFAAYAAADVLRFGWVSQVIAPKTEDITRAVHEATENPVVQILSLIFPDVVELEDLWILIQACRRSEAFSDESIPIDNRELVRLRARIGSDVSWVTGFGPFDFLPITRRAHTELTIRTKPRPQYDWHFKPPLDGIIHLADMSMRGMSDRNLRKLWGASFVTTEKLLGHPPDQESAAKTTFSMPSLLG